MRKYPKSPGASGPEKKIGRKGPAAEETGGSRPRKKLQDLPARKYQETVTRIKISPLARKIAAKNNIDISKVAGIRTQGKDSKGRYREIYSFQQSFS